MSIEIARDDEVAGSDEILTPEALAFIEELHQRSPPPAGICSGRAPSGEEWPAPAGSTSCRRRATSRAATGACRPPPQPCRTAGWK